MDSREEDKYRFVNFLVGYKCQKFKKKRSKEKVGKVSPSGTDVRVY